MKKIIAALMIVPIVACSQTHDNTSKPATQSATTATRQQPAVTPQPQTQQPVQATTPQAEKINWVTIEEALVLQKKNPKHIMIDVYTKWCGPCKTLSKTTFQSDDVAEYVNKNFYCVKFDAESPEPVTHNGTEYTNPNYNPSAAGRNGVHEFSTYLKVQAYPTIVIMDEKGDYLNQSRGLVNPGQLECLLKYFKEGHYKTTAWADFQSTFQITFK